MSQFKTIQDIRQPSLASVDRIRDQGSTVDQSYNTTDNQISTVDTNETQQNQDD